MSSEVDPSTGSEVDVGEENLLPIDAKWLYMGFFVVIGLWFIYLLTGMEGWRWEDYSMPLLAGIPGIALIIVYLFRIGAPERYARLNPSVRQAEAEEEEIEELLHDYGQATEKEAERSPLERQRLEILMIAWVIALPLAIDFFGIFVALPVYVFAFSIYFTRDLKRSVAIALILTLFVYVFFVLILGAKVYFGHFGIELPIPRPQLF